MDIYVDLGFFEYFVWVVYASIFLVFIYTYKSFNPGRINNFLLKGAFVKLLGGLAFALVYSLYYKGGDCNYYYYSINQITKIFYEYPSTYFQLLPMSSDEAMTFLYENNLFVYKVQNAESWALVKLLSPFNILSFNSFLGLTFFTSVISFYGAFYLFKTLDKIIPNSERVLFNICFLVPSVTFWGGGIMKDTVTMAALCFLVYLFYTILYERKRIILNLCLSLILILLIASLKAYIVLAFVPWLMVTIFFYFTNKSKNPVSKVLIIPYLSIIILVFAFFFSKSIFDSSQKYQTEEIQNRIEGFKSWHNQLGGSVYDLGEMDYSVQGYLKKLPAAINVTLFRPYLWETSNIMALANSLEALILLALTVFTFYAVGFARFFRILSKNAFVFGGLIFCLFFAFIVGITSYNFGALSRFKIPLMPIYLFVFYFIYSTHRRPDQGTTLD